MAVAEQGFGQGRRKISVYEKKALKKNEPDAGGAR